ncbi:uncharacterized protein LOC100378474 [Saccoglossus kowalevskii]|uniref:G2/M phase-specific E3 ubiquitin-protein ligase-like n=1 Tax=Saccoglossus kowalevskii TaxID=10224 RepID=A0ABM0MFW6_SACKO|nr:PREDICTED: G2/M phase-specific E3 ubiquitin-protein ligase-like [Saccoglossus kowalevskii]
MPPKKQDIFAGKSEFPQLGVCLFCGCDVDDATKYGKLHYHEETRITVHYYCLLFASGLSQGGDDNDGIQGFLIPDILKETRRGLRLKCSHCPHRGATIGCVVPKCKIKFHYMCGVANQALSQFFGQFNSYCKEHRPQQVVTTVSKKKCVCPICMCKVSCIPANDVLKTPCCKNTWIHRECVQRQALNAGYFFRCATCNNKDDFQHEMIQFGIYVPEQDASWELEDNAFQDLLERHNNCDVTECLCPQGRDYSKIRSKWEIILCHMCGSAGTHIECSGFKTAMVEWVCLECTSTIFKPDKAKSTVKKKTDVVLNSFRICMPPSPSRVTASLSPPTPSSRRHEHTGILQLPQVSDSPCLVRDNSLEVEKQSKFNVFPVRLSMSAEQRQRTNDTSFDECDSSQLDGSSGSTCTSPCTDADSEKNNSENDVSLRKSRPIRSLRKLYFGESEGSVTPKTDDVFDLFKKKPAVSSNNPILTPDLDSALRTNFTMNQFDSHVFHPPKPDVICLSNDDDAGQSTSSENSFANSILPKKFVRSTTRMSMKTRPDLQRRLQKTQCKVHGMRAFPLFSTKINSKPVEKEKSVIVIDSDDSDSQAPDVVYYGSKVSSKKRARKSVKSPFHKKVRLDKDSESDDSDIIFVS